MDNLKSCPFCGDVTPEIRSEGKFHYVGCTNEEECGGEGPRMRDEQYAIECWNRRATLEGDAQPVAVPAGCLNVGHAVRKSKGYPFPGEVRSVFRTKAGLVRYVIEATGAEYAGMLHIFSPDQLEKPGE